MKQPSLNKPFTIIFSIVGLAVLLVIVVGLFLKSAPEPGNEFAAAEPGAGIPDNTAEAGTIGAVWQRQSVADATEEVNQTTSNETIPFNADALYDALQNVRIDENGDVILDNQALEALNSTLQYGEVELSDRNLANLQELIKIGVPGKAGEQTADIVVDYYRYLGAEDEFNAMYEQPSAAADMSTDAYAQQYEELKALRAMYLGQDVAEQLFETADASARYMFEAQKLEADASLTDDEKAERLQTLNDRLTDETVPVDNWRERYDAFLAEKRRIIDAGLAEQEKSAQVEQLMQQHFSASELKKVEHLQIGTI
jgi:hypothetical protein